MKITAYISPDCPWSGSVVLVLEKYGLDFEIRNVAEDSQAMEDMRRLSKQAHTPCVVIDGAMLPDTTGQEVEDYLLSRQLVNCTPAPTTPVLDVPSYIAGVRLADTKRVF
ncbi:MAG: glutaredoxin [Opitutales bacterium]|nr:glutaredoxin [Opitutales bacterium]